MGRIRKTRNNLTESRVTFNTNEYNKFTETFLKQYRLGDRIDAIGKGTEDIEDILDAKDITKYNIFKGRAEIYVSNDGNFVVGYRIPGLEDLNKNPDKTKRTPMITMADGIDNPKGLSASVNGQVVIDRKTESLLHQIRDYDQSTYEHGIRVGNRMYDFTKHLGYSEDFCEQARVAGYLHDIGKLEIDKSILNKKDYLTMHEKEHINTHASNDNVQKYLNNFPENVILAANGHHLSYTEGIGYPDPFLSGDNIPLICRVASICDLYDAMIRERPYKSAGTVKDAITASIGSKNLDPGLMNEFVKMIEKEGQIKVVDNPDLTLSEKQRAIDKTLVDIAIELGVATGTLELKDNDEFKDIIYEDPFTDEKVNVGIIDHEANIVHLVSKEYLKEQIDCDIRFQSGRERRIKDYFNDVTGVPKDEIVILRRGEDTKKDGRPLDTSYEVVFNSKNDEQIHLGSVNYRGRVTDSISQERLMEILEDLENDRYDDLNEESRDNISDFEEMDDLDEEECVGY